jgi:hypothetical protein
MRNCPFCKNPIKPLAEWKGNNGRFYCSEFCADAGDTNEPLATSSAPRATVAAAGGFGLVLIRRPRHYALPGKVTMLRAP